VGKISTGRDADFKMLRRKRMRHSEKDAGFPNRALDRPARHDIKENLRCKRLFPNNAEDPETYGEQIKSSRRNGSPGSTNKSTIETTNPLF
jgi:hypothetical protein